MRRILVPLDGSCFGEAALPLAAASARRDGTGLELVTVHTPYPHPDIPSDAAPELEAMLRARTAAYLDDAAQRVRDGFGVPVVTAVLEGATVPAILNYTLTHPPRLIVMSTHGRTGPSRYLLGSTADRLVRELHCPFLLVRPGAAPPPTGLPEVARRVLVALDGSPMSESVLDEVERFLSPLLTTIHLVRVVAPIEFYPVGIPAAMPPVQPDLLDHQLAAAHQYLDQVAARLGLDGWTVLTEVVMDRSPAMALLTHAEARGCDMIAIATRGLGGIQRALFGSVADKIIRGATTPVLIVNPPSVEFSAAGQTWARQEPMWHPPLHWETAR